MKIGERKNAANFLRFGLVLALLAGSWLSVPAAPVQAATYVVTVNSDSGPGSLRDVIAAASSGDTITFQSNLAGQTIQLESSLEINTDLTIDGSGLTSSITIRGLLMSAFAIYGTVTLNGLTITNSSGFNGGGIYNAGTLTVANSTFSGNSSNGIGGGAIFNDGQLTVTNSTFFNNSALYSGGGIYNRGTLSVTNSTFSGNSADFDGGGIYNDSVLEITNTILANSSPGSYDCFNNMIVGPSRNNLVQTNQGCVGIVSTDDPMLDVLGDYNGPTQTMALLSGSPAINAGDDGDCPATDQRGYYRPINAHCDIGAFEYTYLATDPATDVTTGAATLNGMINPYNASTTVTFLYGLTAAYGSSVTADQSPVSGASNTAVTAALSGLLNNMTYHFRVVAASPSGTIQGYDQTFTTAHVAGIRYVKSTAVGLGDCLSWANACTPQIALATSKSGDEVWVVAGTYTPGALNTDTFQLKDGVALYGGFAGTETQRSQRDPAANLTILSGDIDHNDSQTPVVTDASTVTGIDTNSYHVVTGANGATLDGFTVTAGNASIEPGGKQGGGGMVNDGVSPIVANVTFSGNLATAGGGMSIGPTGSPTLTNVAFIGNLATAGGGLIIMQSSPELTDVSFNSNYATQSDFIGGGGILSVTGSPKLTNVTFSGNTAMGDKVFGGGMTSLMDTNLSLTNVTFSGNTAPGKSTRGGGLAIIQGTSPVIRNSIFWDNSTGAGFDQFFSVASAAELSDSILQGECPDDTTCTNVLPTDPKLGSLGNYGGYTQTIPLLANSSAIDAGNDATCAATDQRGVVRPQGAHCDIGAYEQMQLMVKANDKTIFFGDPDPIFDFTTIPAGVPFSSDPICDAAAHLGTGDYAISCSGGSPQDSQYLLYYADGKLTVSPHTTTTALASSLSPSRIDQPVTFTATVASGTGALTGTVTFKDGSAILGTGDLSGGIATFSTSTLSLGDHSITAEYAGDGNNAPSTSALLVQKVVANIAATATSLNATENTAPFAKTWNLTATVVAASGKPTGTITFKDGSTILGTAALSNGTGALEAITLHGGPHSFTAEYSGDANYAGSLSAVVSFTTRYYLILPLIFNNK